MNTHQKILFVDQFAIDQINNTLKNKKIIKKIIAIEDFIDKFNYVINDGFNCCRDSLKKLINIDINDNTPENIIQFYSKKLIKLYNIFIDIYNVRIVNFTNKEYNNYIKNIKNIINDEQITQFADINYYIITTLNCKYIKDTIIYNARIQKISFNREEISIIVENNIEVIKFKYLKDIIYLNQYIYDNNIKYVNDIVVLNKADNKFTDYKMCNNIQNTDKNKLELITNTKMKKIDGKYYEVKENTIIVVPENKYDDIYNNITVTMNHKLLQKLKKFPIYNAISNDVRKIDIRLLDLFNSLITRIDCYVIEPTINNINKMYKQWLIIDDLFSTINKIILDFNEKYIQYEKKFIENELENLNNIIKLNKNNKKSNEIVIFNMYIHAILVSKFNDGEKHTNCLIYKMDKTTNKIHYYINNSVYKIDVNDKRLSMTFKKSINRFNKELNKDAISIDKLYFSNLDLYSELKI
jgi:hypothetical protein